MSSNENMLIQKYGDGLKENSRFQKSKSTSLEFYYTKKHLSDYITKDSRILEVGCATGYYGVYYSDKCKEYVGVDIVPNHIKVFHDKIKDLRLKNVSCQVGDATDLREIASDSFDVVLCLGPMYHLPPEEREKVFKECHRVCAKNGIVAFAYLNQVGEYAGVCVHDEWRKGYPNARANEMIFENCTDDVHPYIYYYTMPEEIENVARKNGFEKISNLGLDFSFLACVINDISEEKFELFRPLYDKMTSCESCTGMSAHGLLICRKNL